MTSSLCEQPTSEPILTPSIAGSPITVFESCAMRDSWKASMWGSGTSMRRMAVHFWPAFTVISLRISFTNRSNSGVPGPASGPKIAAFNESASKLKGTEFSIICGCTFKARPVVADPVNVTTSRSSTKSRILRAEPQTS